MKSQSKMFKSAILAIGFFLAAFTVTLAQSNETTPAWTTSKDVQKVANKQLFNNEELRNSHIRVTTVSPTLAVSKDVHRKKGDEVQSKGNVASTYPSWIISKGVHQRKK